MVSSASVDSPDRCRQCIRDRAAEPGGSMPRSPTVPRSHDMRPTHILCRASHTCIVHLSRLLCLLIIFLCTPAGQAQAAPQLWLPTPPGETWKVLQGYGCGSHNGWDRYSLDIVNADGRTRGAPVRAAAD